MANFGELKTLPLRPPRPKALRSESPRDEPRRPRKIGYRLDIDGLRAVAVLAIVLFHINESWLPGGFVGVDIFFVISGFLITSLIAAEVQRGEFSLTAFYIRRVKRIFPALAVVTFATLICGHFLLTPEHLVELAKSAIASTFSVANIFFVYGVDSGYFAEDSATKPLLHLWSLGVEEQFYLLWPVVSLALLVRLRRSKLLSAVATMIVIGFCVSEWLSMQYPTFGYYMLPSRAFELLIGAFVAFLPTSLVLRLPAIIINAVATVGIALIAYSLLHIDAELPFPGVNALPATVGAALVIFSGARTSLVSRILSLRVLVVVGLISYSLYLWHWPLLALLRYSQLEMTLLTGSMAFVAMIALAAVTYRYVERPCRYSKHLAPKAFFRQLAVPVTAISALAFTAIATSGLGLYFFSESFKRNLALLSADTRPAYNYDYVCQKPRLTEKDTRRPSCIINGTSEPSILLWGDSNAAHYIGILGSLAKSTGFSFRNFAHSACPPLLNTAHRFAQNKYRESCEASHKVALRALDRYQTIIIAAGWSGYQNFSHEFQEELIATVKTLIKRGKHVVILGQVVRFPGYDRNCLRKALKNPLLDCFAGPTLPDKGLVEPNKTLKAIANNIPNVRYVDFNQLICKNLSCSPYSGHAPLYFDQGHLSMKGSWLLGKQAVETGLFSDFLSF